MRYYGVIRVYEQDKVIYTKTFQHKGHLKKIMQEYQGLQMSIMFQDDEVVGKSESKTNKDTITRRETKKRSRKDTKETAQRPG